MIDIRLEIATAREAVIKRNATDTQYALVALANEMGSVVSRLENQGFALARVVNELDEMVNAIVKDGDDE